MAEIDFAVVDGVISSECIAHEHKQVISPGVQAPTVSYMQQIAASAAAADPPASDTEIAKAATVDHLHELYEWIGGVSCGVQGRPTETQEHASYVSSLENEKLPC